MFFAPCRWFAAGLLLIVAAAPARAQLRISYDPQGEPTNLQVIALRPNVVQPIYFSYYNPGPGIKKNVKIAVEQIALDGKAKELTKTVVAKVEVKKFAPVQLALPSPKDPKSPWPALDGPPFALRFLIDDGTTKEPTRIDVPIKLQEPREYVKVREAKYDPLRKRLSFKLSSDEPLDPPCPVELSLQPSVIPGLIPNSAGTFRQTLSKENQEVELSADNVVFEGGVPPVNGRVYLNVDGFDRAFMYKCTFAEGTLTPLKDMMRARIVANRYSLPAAKIPVIIEVDAKSQEEGDEDPMQRTLVEVKFDRAGQGNYEKVLNSPFRGLRSQTIEYKSDGDAVLFKTMVKDRVIELDALGINGKRSLQVRLISPKLRVIPIANEQDQREEKLALYNPGAENKFAPLTFDRINDAVVAEMILDSTPAEELKLVNVPAKARPEDHLRPQLAVRPRLLTMQAPIVRVAFFFGEADKDNKLPEKTLKIDAVWDKDKEVFVPREEMIVPAEQRGKMFVSALVETATGVLSSRKQPILVLSKDAKDPSEADVLTTITGIVSRGGRMQPDALVVLAKAKPNKDDVPKTTKTTDDGKFEFTDIEPGTYVLSARRLDTAFRMPLTVPKNKDKIAGIDLQLKAQ